MNRVGVEPARIPAGRTMRCSFRSHHSLPRAPKPRSMHGAESEHATLCTGRARAQGQEPRDLPSLHHMATFPRIFGGDARARLGEREMPCRPFDRGRRRARKPRETTAPPFKRMAQSSQSSRYSGSSQLPKSKSLTTMLFGCAVMWNVTLTLSTVPPPTLTICSFSVSVNCSPPVLALSVPPNHTAP